MHDDLPDENLPLKMKQAQTLNVDGLKSSKHVLSLVSSFMVEVTSF